ncbi:hypothetical protein ASPFODRAFT_502619 [Aspergillus luchuensis CBS 106.47]|uniref:Major facilitator superfamily (MFS) profile domain-containing protein n=1 Tax=Aspergillus luchuensis (strain CBS 106.47) TaxID=1137211 RepID=A0A1M3TSK3_ASPLC|nr:hypothetical protein ASPFODRAFT_502619 [Aspergillus luchuensis CBS 106.47]
MGIGIAGCIPGAISVCHGNHGLRYWCMASIIRCRWRSIISAASGQVPRFGLSSAVFNLILPYIFNPEQGALRGKTGFVCAGFSAIALVGTWLYLPEMKDRTPSEIDDMFGAVVPARQFRKWSPLLADPPSSDRSPQA